MLLISDIACSLAGGVVGEVDVAVVVECAGRGVGGTKSWVLLLGLGWGRPMQSCW